MSAGSKEMLFSYSSLERARACPARFQLSHAEYPAIWQRDGFPSRVTYAAVRGLVIHSCLERITKVAAESPATGDELTTALRTLGGYSELIDVAIRNVLSDLRANPRARGLVSMWQRRLAEDHETIRHRVQSTLRQVVVPGGREPASRLSSGEGMRVERGVFAEFHLRSSDMPLHGWADLLMCDEPRDHIIDFKTGQASESHEDQLRLYAALWLKDERNVYRRPVAMKAIYGEFEQDFGEMVESEATDVLSEWRSRIESAQQILEGTVARAVPAKELCSLCPVKVVCDPYWESLVPNESARTLEFVDLEGTIVESLGTRSWQIDLLRAPNELMAQIVHSDSSRNGLAVGDRVRILGASMRLGDEEVEPSLWLGRNAEMFVIRDEQLFLTEV